MRLLTLLLVAWCLAAGGATVTAVQAGKPEAPQVVSGPGYEGAIVPVSSRWHDLSRVVMKSDERSAEPVHAWTPQPTDVAVAERSLVAFLALAEKEPLRVKETSTPGYWSDRLPMHLARLSGEVGALKRHYYGQIYDKERRILIRVFDEKWGDWRSRPVVVKDGGCRNSWFDVSLDTRRVVRFQCGGFA